jgi:hypothetical protein
MNDAGWPFAVLALLGMFAGMEELLSFKAESVRDAAAELRRTLDEAGASGVTLGLNGFAPPWSHITGLDYQRVYEAVQATRCKLFTFHWPMIVRWWSETLLAWNPGLDEQAVLRAVQGVLDLSPPPDEHRRTLAEYGMPRPDEPHPIAMEALTRKIDAAVGMAGLAGKAERCLAYVHSYRPAAEFRRVLEAVLASEARGCWIQRYGYLSDEKLAIMRDVWPR